MPGWLGPGELILLAVVLLVIFGPKRLPEAGRSLGKGIREFRSSISGDDEKEEPAEAEVKSLEAPVRDSRADDLSEELRVERRERLIERAQHEGRFGADEADDYRKLYDADPEATEKVIGKLPAPEPTAPSQRDA